MERTPRAWRASVLVANSPRSQRMASDFELLVALVGAAAVSRDDIGEVVAVDQLGQVVELLADDRLGRDAGGLRFGFGCGDELLHDACERPALGLGPRCEVAHQLGIERARLAAARVQPAVGVEVGARNDQLLLHRDGANEVQEEGLACPVFADDQAESRPTVGDAVDVAVQGLDFAGAADLDEVLACARHDT